MSKVFPPDDLAQLLADPISFHYSRAAVHGRRAASEAVSDAFRHLGLSQSDPKVTQLLSRFRSEKAGTFHKLLSGLVGEGNMRPTAYRADWLACEACVVNTLDKLLWAAMLAKEIFIIPGNHQQHFMEVFCEEIGSGDLFEAALFPASLRGWAETVIGLVLRVTEYFHAQLPGLTVENEEVLRTLQKDAGRLASQWEVYGAEGKEAALDALVRNLSALSVHVGILLTGSYAVDYKRDQLSDIDLFCYCTEVPDDATRDQLLQNLGARQNWRCGGFEYIDMVGAGVHLIFIPIENQHRAFRELYDAGIEIGEVDFSDPKRSASFAASAYRWISGRILTDTEGTLAAFQQRVHSYPDPLQERVFLAWGPVWDRYQARCREALAGQDHLAARSALHRCTEAALRVLLARNQIYVNPVDDPKWLVLEIANLPEHSRQAVEPALQYLPHSVGEPMVRRFDMICKLWKLANPTE